MPDNWVPRPPEKAYLMKKYGVSQEDWWALFRRQGGCCNICGRDNRALQVDHDHRADPRKRSRRHLLWSQRGSVRGLLCWRCNQALQAFNDDPVLMRSAANYIVRPPAWELWPEERRGWSDATLT